MPAVVLCGPVVGVCLRHQWMSVVADDGVSFQAGCCFAGGRAECQCHQRSVSDARLSPAAKVAWASRANAVVG